MGCGLEVVTRRQFGLADGANVNGIAFTQFDGTVYWDKTGLVTRAHSQQRPSRRKRHGEAAKDAKLPKPIQDLIAAAPVLDKRIRRAKAERRALFHPLCLRRVAAGV